ncbi:hypothetical protein [Halorubrum sp. SP9]|uniref:hypothetical protein n=1 Tax=Halorubrum sp. SP9 TaxID=1537267 RepID=UPI0010F7289E|nr:hypothetical protein [Halorubrum sp. SP9]TKX69256.1 hypothetical protein EXE45_09055 [Halorubrum sp. SP9]
MPNTIKSTGADAVALQITREARSAGLVDERDGQAKRLAPVSIFGFDGLLLLLDRERVADRQIAELVTVAAADTETAYPGGRAKVTIRGEGYQVALPGAADAGFDVGDRAPCVTAQCMLVIHRDGDGRLVGDLKTIRQQQVA